MITMIWPESAEFVNSIEFRALQGGITALVILFPLSLIRDLGGLRYMNLVSLLALFYTLIVLLVELPAYIQQNWNSEGFYMAYACIDLNIFTGSSLTFYAYTCQIVVLPIYSELVNPNPRRIKKVVNRSVFIDIFFYMLISCAGYFSMLNQT
mmetsp:Transcript_47666/g.34917  ORF Transcript_47666/g.34917 Transcript_47666/m.34917 type:complete len:152 (-) Transcript_47666:550-1005(-)